MALRHCGAQHCCRATMQPNTLHSVLLAAACKATHLTLSARRTVSDRVKSASSPPWFSRSITGSSMRTPTPPSRAFVPKVRECTTCRGEGQASVLQAEPWASLQLSDPAGAQPTGVGVNQRRGGGASQLKGPNSPLRCLQSSWAVTRTADSSSHRHGPLKLLPPAAAPRGL